MNRPSIRELECFIAAAEEQNFTKAARRLNLSQPPFTRQIQSLEDKLGCRLFERTTRNVKLTPAGVLFWDDSRQTLAFLDRAIAAARRAQGGEPMRLRLGFVGALMSEDTVRLFQSFRQAHPHCQIQLADLSPTIQVEELLEGRLDGGFVGAPPTPLPKGFAALVWKQEPLVLVFPSDHPLAKRPPTKFAQLRQECWVTVTREAAPAFRRQFDCLCEDAGFTPVILHEAERAAAVLSMVAASQGITLLPVSIAKSLQEGVAFHSLPRGMNPALEHTFVYRPAAACEQLRAFVALLPNPKIRVRSKARAAFQTGRLPL